METIGFYTQNTNKCVARVSAMEFLRIHNCTIRMMCVRMVFGVAVQTNWLKSGNWRWNHVTFFVTIYSYFKCSISRRKKRCGEENRNINAVTGFESPSEIESNSNRYRLRLLETNSYKTLILDGIFPTFFFGLRRNMLEWNNAYFAWETRFNEAKKWHTGGRREVESEERKILRGQLMTPFRNANVTPIQIMS